VQLLTLPEVKKVVPTRSFRTLRLSVTPLCNMTCTYCNPAGVPFLGRVKEADFYTRIVRDLLQTQDISQIQLTGGEPAIYPHLTALIRQLRSLPLERLSLTTNGLALHRRAAEWQAAGLTDINVSLDAMDPRIFQTMTGSGDHERILQGIVTARKLGLPVKINATIMRNHNEDQILPLLLFGREQGAPVRYLELMAMGPLTGNHRSLFFSRAEILQRIEQSFPVQSLGRPVGGTAEYFLADGIRFGIIANHSASFCEDCDRLRVLHDGKISGCLSSKNHYAFAGETGAAQEKALRQALADKTSLFTGSDQSMQELGG